MQIKRTFTDLETQLHRQIKFLRNSCALFDNGEDDEACRLATTIRVLVKDPDNPRPNNKTVSLLKQLELKDELKFYDTGVYPNNLIQAQTEFLKKQGVLSEEQVVASYQISDVGLVVLGINSKGQKAWVAPLAIPKIPFQHPFHSALLPPQSFDKWWTTPLIQGNTKMFSRSDLVLIMSDNDGGAHVDAQIDKDYVDLTFDDRGLQWENSGKDFTMTNEGANWESVSSNIAAASVRQIAFEVLTTLEQFLSTSDNKFNKTLAE